MLPTNALYKVINEVLPEELSQYDSKYEARLKVQKLIYLLEQFRGKQYYDFSWYLAGPYSSSLTYQMYNDLLKTDEQTLNKWDGFEFTESVSKNLEELNTMIEECKSLNNDLICTQIYELLASIWYIYENNNFEEEEADKIKAIKNKLVLNKPHFKETEKLNEIIQLVLKNYSMVKARRS